MNKILVIEEEKVTIQKVQERLSHVGFEMLSASNGRQGFEYAKDKTPDLIITDSVIPGMSGFELCKAIKLNQDTKSIPLVVMTEKHRMEESFMFLGINDFLSKPLCMDELEAVVRKKLNFLKTMNLQKTKILINGRPEVLTCCQELLRQDPHWTGYFAEDNDSYIRDARKYAPDVILVDLLMPKIAADDMIKKFRSMPELKNTVFLGYYAFDNESGDYFALQADMIGIQYLKKQTLEAGAKEYLGPFSPVTFLNLINAYKKS